jgi:hypothetical protein
MSCPDAHGAAASSAATAIPNQIRRIVQPPKFGDAKREIEALQWRLCGRQKHV